MKHVLIMGIRGYQKYLSPLKTVHCPYTPTCSQYAMEAIEVHGAAKGLFLAVKRVLCCNPCFPGGYDPVPPRKGGKE